MQVFKRAALGILPILAAGAVFLAAQEPTVSGNATARASGASAAAIAGSKEDPAAVERGGKLFVANCGGCHGPTGRGGVGAPDLVRSILVLDDEKGILIAPVMRNGRPEQGMPPSNLAEAQIADIVAWLHVQTYAAGHRATYAFQDVLTGDAKRGEAYFQAAGTCHTCHSPTGDLKGIGGRYDAFALQARWLQPARRQGRPRRPGRRRFDEERHYRHRDAGFRASRSRARSIASTISASRCAMRPATIIPSRAMARSRRWKSTTR